MQNIILAVPSFSLSNVINVALQNTFVGGKGRMSLCGITQLYMGISRIYSSFSWSSDFSSFLSPLSSAVWSPSSPAITFAALSTSVGLESNALVSLSRAVLSGKLEQIIIN